MKEIYLYGGIYSWTAQAVMTAMEQYKNDDIKIRVNSAGGEPEAGWGMVAKFSEHKGKKLIVVDGKAQSTAAFMLAYADEAESLDVSQFLLHRAAYPSWVESNKNYMTDAMWNELNAVNSKLRTALEGKIDVKKFETITGVTLDQMFSNDTRIDVPFTAEQALEIGLISSIKKITPEKKAEIEAFEYKIAAEALGLQKAAENIDNPKTVNMTIDKLKAEHPSLFADVVKLGADQERDRVGSWMAFVDVDAKAVAEGIKEGKTLNATAMAELTRKALSAQSLKSLEEEAPNAVVTKEAETKEKTEKEAKVAAFEAEIDKHFNLKK